MSMFWKKAEQSPGHKLALALRTAGTVFGGLAASILSPGFKDVEIAALNKYFDLKISLDAPWWVGVLCAVLCPVIYVLAWRVIRQDLASHDGKQLIAFRHHSLRNSVPPLLKSDALPIAMRRRTLSHVDCDLTVQLADGHPSSGDLISAVEEQRRRVEYLLSSTRTLPDVGTAYYGIAHIPFQILAGRMFGTSLSPLLYELDNDRATWRPLLDGNGTSLRVRRTTTSVAGLLADVVIRVSVSLEVGLADVRQVVTGPFEDIHVHVAHPARNIVTHVGQVDHICKEFRDALESLQNRMAPGGRVHLFLAVPMSVGFSLGRVLSSSVNPDATCYNHVAQASPRYAWGLRVNADVPSSAMVMMPQPIPFSPATSLP